MATSISPATRNPQIGHGGGSLPPPLGRGGDDNRGWDGSPDYQQRLRRARLGLAIAIVPIMMMFVAFTAAYLARKGVPDFAERTDIFVHDWMRIRLPVQLLLVNTFLLLAGSATIELARRRLGREVALAPAGSIPGVSLGHEPNVPWLPITAVLGVGFLTGQWMAWQELAARGFYLTTSASSSFVYILTAAHGLHLIGGLLVLLYAVVAAILRRPVEARLIVVDVTAWYWHFMAVLWIYIFILLQFAQ